MKEMYPWILVDKKTKLFYMGHKSLKKPAFGNNGKESTTHPDYEWVKWGKELPPETDSETGEFLTYKLVKAELVKQ